MKLIITVLSYIFLGSNLWGATNSDIYNDWLLVKVENPKIEDSGPYIFMFSVLTVNMDQSCVLNVLNEGQSVPFSRYQGHLDTALNKILFDSLEFSIVKNTNQILVLEYELQGHFFQNTYMQVEDQSGSLSLSDSQFVSNAWDVEFAPDLKFRFDFSSKFWSDRKSNMVAVRHWDMDGYHKRFKEKWSVVNFKGKSFLSIYINKYYLLLFSIIEFSENSFKARYYDGEKVDLLQFNANKKSAENEILAMKNIIVSVLLPF